MRYEAGSSSYFAPVLSPNELREDYPDVSDRTSRHLLTAKVYESPELTERALRSVADNAPDYLDPIIVDDSVTETGRIGNQEIAHHFGAKYYHVRGTDSIVAAFSEFLKRRGADELATYLGRISINYPRIPEWGSWGGARGAQNVCHLVNIMTYGEQGVSPDKWLSTFIDQDVIVPPTAKTEIFPLLAMYANMGVGLTASLYTHHLGSPTGLSARALKHLVEKRDEMTSEDVNQEIKRIIGRSPTLGLMPPEGSHSKYTPVAAYNLDFPGGNYTLAGDMGFTRVPVSIMGHDDQAYGAMLHLFVGAKEMGVARAPGFTHIRKQDAPNAVHGNLIEYLRKIGPTIKTEQAAFLKACFDHAEAIETPVDRIEGLRLLLDKRDKGQLKAVDAIVEICGRFARDQRLQSSRGDLLAMRDAADEFIKSRAGVVREFDLVFAQRFIKTALSLQPYLSEEAYKFGEMGGLKRYGKTLHIS